LARTDDNGDRFGALLGRRLGAREGEGRDDCPDVGAVAAYYERSLPHNEREAIERHLAGCAPCRAELAVLARAARESAAAGGAEEEPGLHRWWSSAPVGWAVAGAIALIVAIGLGRDYYNQEAPREQIAMEMASNRPAVAPAQDALKDAKRAVAEPKSAAAVPLSAARASRELQTMERGELNASVRAHRIAAPPSPAAGAAIRPVLPAQASAPPPPAAPFASGAPSIAKSETNLNALSGRTVPEMAGGPGTAMAPSAPPPAPPPAQPSVVTRPLMQERMQVTGSASSASPGSAAGAAAAIPGAAIGGAIAQNQTPTFARPWPHYTVTSPDGSIRWEFGNQGTIERFGPTGLATIRIPGVADLIAGSAPSSSVCWIVGQGGVVVRTIDGSNWTKVSSPTSSDLIAVTAQGADTALVTARDSQRYLTSDGGQTWQPQ